MVSHPRALWLTAFLLLPAVAPAQGRLIERMLQDLVESQLERQNPAPPAVAVPGGVLVDAPAVNLPDLRGRLGKFSNEANGLAGALRKELRRDASLAPLMVQTLRVKSRADLLRRKYKQPTPPLVVRADLARLDQEWRDVSFRLSAAAGLPGPCRDAVGRLDTLCAACVTPLQLAPQVDRREVARLSSALAAELHHLERDVEFEVRSRRKASRLLIAIQRTEGLARLVGESALAGDPAPVIVEAYKRFSQTWTPLAGELYGLSDRHIVRTLGEVEELSASLRACLRIAASLDRARVLSLARAAQASFASAYGGVTLAELVEKPNAPALIAAAQRLNRETNAFCECAAGTAADAELLRRWSDLEGAWRQYDTLYGPILGRRREACVACVAALRGALGAPTTIGFNRRAVAREAAELVAVADQAQLRIELWRSRPGAQFSKSLIRDAQSLIRDCRRLHEQCAGTIAPVQLAADCRLIAEQWARLRPQLLACRTVDQRVLRRLADDGTAHLVRLQAMLDAAAAGT